MKDETLEPLLDKDGNPVALSDHPLLADCLRSFTRRWLDAEPVFFGAMEQSDAKKIQVVVKFDLDTKEADPFITTVLSFRDKCIQKGLPAIMTLRSSETNRIQDPAQPNLPFGEGESKAQHDGESEGGEATTQVETQHGAFVTHGEPASVRTSKKPKAKSKKKAAKKK